MSNLREDEVLSVYVTNDVFARRSATGYGSKIPLQYKIKLTNNRAYRLYCCIYSNSGSCYIVQGGVKRCTSDIEFSEKFQSPIVSDNIKF